MIKIVTLWIRDYFGFSRIETRGIFFLLGILSITFICTIWVEKQAVKPYMDREADVLLLDSLMKQIELVAKPQIAKSQAPTKMLFSFNPNEASFSTLRQLGVSESLSARILSYRNKGGKFRVPEDLLKIYDFPHTLYDELEAYINIPQDRKAAASFSKATSLHTETIIKEEIRIESQPEKVEKIYLDINQADSTTLMRISGIGNVFSSRIVKYRDKLGGFHSLAQLQEIYHINETALQALESHTFIKESFEPKKIKINEADFNTLLKHPYIDYDLAKAIMNHLRIYGKFSSADQLKEVYFIKEELLVKLLPYIVI